MILKEYDYLKELSFHKKDNFINNFSYYFCDQNNINLFLVLEETALKDKGKTILKVNAFYVYNKKVVNIDKNELNKSILSNNILDKYIELDIEQNRSLLG